MPIKQDTKRDGDVEVASGEARDFRVVQALRRHLYE